MSEPRRRIAYVHVQAHHVDAWLALGWVEDDDSERRGGLDYESVCLRFDGVWPSEGEPPTPTREAKS